MSQTYVYNIQQLDQTELVYFLKKWLLSIWSMRIWIIYKMSNINTTYIFLVYQLNPFQW